MMSVEPCGNMFANSLAACRDSPTRLRNRLDGLSPAELAIVGRARAISCAASTASKAAAACSEPLNSRSGSLADLRKERLARAASLGDALLASSTSSLPTPPPSRAALGDIDLHPRRRNRAAAVAAAELEGNRPRASSMPPAPRSSIFPITETEAGN